MRLSAAVLCFNEVKTISDCIESLSFCDEIVVVDDGSTDGTWELLQTLPVRAVQHRHTTFADQRDFARSLTSGEWLLSMDADERVTPELRVSILAAIPRADAPDGFHLRRRNPYPPPLSGEQWTRHPRLVRRERCRWIDTDSPHAPLDTRGLNLHELTPGWLEHLPPPDLPTVLRKAINRSLILAAQERVKGRRTGIGRTTAATVARFVRSFFLQGGFRHGFSGLCMALAAAFEAFCKQAFLAETTARLLHLTDGGPGSYGKDGKVVGSARTRTPA